MPCTSPLQAVYAYEDGKKIISFCSANQRRFIEGKSTDFKGTFFSNGKWFDVDGHLTLPCGRCISCRLERSRQVAVRCMHEAKMYEDNCFVTLTYAPEHLPSDGSLVRKDPQDFMKRLRYKFKDHKIRFYGCGEYGTEGGRPHYHFCLFNFNFKDRKRWYKDENFWYYKSDDLADLWPFGHVVVCDFSFETAAYVARYCTKKINGKQAVEHYAGKLPEFPMFSNRPGIGAPWFEKYAKTDLYPHDSVVVRGHECSPPRYYDKLRERHDPFGFDLVKEARLKRAIAKQEDNSYLRLQDKMKCVEARFSKMVRKLETGLSDFG